MQSDALIMTQSPRYFFGRVTTGGRKEGGGRPLVRCVGVYCFLGKGAIRRHKLSAGPEGGEGCKFYCHFLSDG